jgi:RNA recognition motif-containing protein
MSVRLYVGNLPKELERQELEAVFADFDGSVSTKVITDRKTGKCRGFGFVTVKTDEEADRLIEKFNGYVLNDSEIKLEKALPRTKGSDEKGPDEAAASAPSGGGSSPSPRRGKGGGGKSPKKGNSTGFTEPESVQPDPRWAQDLEKLKQMLAAQTASS